MSEAGHGSGQRHAHDDAGHAHHHHEHGHGHVHGHGHRHRHVHAPTRFGRAFAVGIALNLAFVLAEAFYGLAANSLALIADAGHNLGDVLALAAAWAAATLGRRRPTPRYTYGVRSTPILVALGNAVMPPLVTGRIAWEAIHRLMLPEAVAGGTVMVVAAIGILVNAATAAMFASGRAHDLNIRSVYLHMAGDAAIALGVLAAGALILWTGWVWLDPAVGLVVSLVIVLSTWSLLREAVDLALGAVPRRIDASLVHQYLVELPGVCEVHDLHIWAMSTTEVALTAHLVRPEAGIDDALLARAADELDRRFGIGHATLQIELGQPGYVCALAPAHVV